MIKKESIKFRDEHILSLYNQGYALEEIEETLSFYKLKASRISQIIKVLLKKSNK